ncbi:hypothetical protein HanRHA438_Chr08g0341331 [Helianthus annuus]|nr:hypothetical protein HanIR_Chr08g0356631 [Helianthus annuus]KAJ0897047.1 hypothetical protein HanRHA438_Chr08g0341331 [Helianthus annuus]
MMMSEKRYTVTTSFEAFTQGTMMSRDPVTVEEPQQKQLAIEDNHRKKKIAG